MTYAAVAYDGPLIFLTDFWGHSPVQRKTAVQDYKMAIINNDLLTFDNTITFNILQDRAIPSDHQEEHRIRPYGAEYKAVGQIKMIATQYTFTKRKVKQDSTRIH